MKIPKHLKIGGHRFKIKLVSHEKIIEILQECAPGMLAENAYSGGLVNLRDQIIYINKDATESAQEEALFHEVVHIICPNADEPETQHIAFTLHQVLRSNNLLK